MIHHINPKAVRNPILSQNTCKLTFSEDVSRFKEDLRNHICISSTSQGSHVTLNCLNFCAVPVFTSKNLIVFFFISAREYSYLQYNFETISLNCKLVALLAGHSPKMAKIRDEPQKLE